MWQDYKKNIMILKNDLSRFIKFQLASKLILIIVLLPLFDALFKYMMHSKGLHYITNGLLLKFLISPQGLLMMFFTIIFSWIVMLIEIGGLIVISHQSIMNASHSSFHVILRYCLNKGKYLLGLDGLLILFYMVVIAPLVDSNLKSSILSTFRLPPFILDAVQKYTFYYVFLGLFLILVVILAIRWSFSIHVLILNPEKQFLKKSGFFIKNNVKFLFKESLKFGLYTALLGLFIVIFFIIVSILLYLALSLISESFAFLIIYSLGILLLFIVSFFYEPLHIIHMTRLYHQMVEDIPTTLNLKVTYKRHFIDHIMNSKALMTILFIIALSIISISSAWFIESLDLVMYDVTITAHRGSSFEAPENTLSAIAISIKNGADFVEIDVQETGDHSLILMHDTNLKRTTGFDREVWEVDLDLIKSLDVGRYFSPRFEGEVIPTLEEVIIFCEGKINLNIEVKTHGYEKVFFEELVQLFETYDLYSSSVVSSTNYEALQKIEQLNPKIKTGYIMFFALGDLNELNVDFYSIEESLATDAFIAEAHAVGREVHVWTLNTKDSMENAIKKGVDNIITDYDKVLKELIQNPIIEESWF